MKRKISGTLFLAGLLVLSVMVIFSTPAVAEEEDPVLWVVPDNPTRWIDLSSDQLLQETVVEDVNMGIIFSGNVLVLHQASPEPHDNATDVYLKFFVHDNSNIDDIEIGTAKRVQPSIATTDPNPGSNGLVKTSTFDAVVPDPLTPVPAGYGVEYLIGDIPFSGGPSQTGDPEPDVNDFDPDKADYYIEVPFTINFKDTPEEGFVLYVYAKNYLTGQARAKTAWSHDCGFHQIPEFSTIAIPIASILGLLFFFNHRKHRKK